MAQPLYGSYFGQGLSRPVARCVDPNATQAFGVFDNMPDVSNLPLPSAPAFGTVQEPSVKRARNMIAFCLGVFVCFGVRCAHILTSLFIVQDA